MVADLKVDRLSNKNSGHMATRLPYRSLGAACQAGLGARLRPNITTSATGQFKSGTESCGPGSSMPAQGPNEPGRHRSGMPDLASEVACETGSRPLQRPPRYSSESFCSTQVGDGPSWTTTRYRSVRGDPGRIVTGPAAIITGFTINRLGMLCQVVGPLPG